MRRKADGEAPDAGAVVLRVPPGCRCTRLVLVGAFNRVTC
jgi:hypothetical protein